MDVIIKVSLMLRSMTYDDVFCCYRLTSKISKNQIKKDQKDLTAALHPSNSVADPRVGTSQKQKESLSSYTNL